MSEVLGFVVIWLTLWVALEVAFARWWRRIEKQPEWNWLTKAEVTIGFALHNNLLPEFIWIWRWGAEPPWEKRQ